MKNIFSFATRNELEKKTLSAYSELGFVEKTTRALEQSIVNFKRFPTLDAKKLVNAPKMSAHHRGICHF